MITTLFNRIRRIQVGNIDVSHLDVEFSVKKTLKREPNTCELTVYNMKRDNLASIRRTSDLFVEVSAGYESDGEPTLLFRGNANREVFIFSTKTENVLKVKARDGRRSTRARVNRSYDPDVPLRRVLRDLASDMGVGNGNLDDFVNESLNATGNSSFPQGYVTSGQAWVNFDRVVRAQGLRWSIQNGNVQILRQQRTRLATAKVLNSRTGLIESPQRDKQGKVTCTVLIQPGIEPGKIVRVESRFIEGDYEVQETTYKGNTKGSSSQWQASLVLKPLRTG